MSEIKQLGHIFLIDGSGFIFRAFHALPLMNRSDGTPVNAVFGYTKMLMKLVDDANADYIAVIFDKARKTFRNDIYPEYKANRPPPPDELIPQFDLVRQATKALNVMSIDLDGFEADDLIATYAIEAAGLGMRVTIVSSDKDLMQLVSPNITMFDSMKNRQIGRQEVIEKFGVPPESVIDVQALAGDSTDNVPGVEGIGIKTAAQLIKDFGSLENLLDHAIEIKQPKRREKLIEQATEARVSKKLVTLRRDVPLEIPVQKLEKQEFDSQKFIEFAVEQDFKSLAAEVSKKAGIDQAHARNSPLPLQQSYTLIQEESSLQAWVADGMDAAILAVDTETTSLNPLRAELVGISLSINFGNACYIPLGHRSSVDQGNLDLTDHSKATEKEIKQIEVDVAIDLLKPLLEHRGVLKVGQNIKYDMQVLNRHGINLMPYDDTMLISYVLGCGLHNHGMDELAQRYIGHNTVKFTEIVGTGKNKLTFDKVPIQKALTYAAEDADITLRLHKRLKRQLVHDHLVTIYETIERPLVAVLANMERLGIRIDAMKLKELSADFSSRLDTLGIEIHELAGREFNIASPKQLGEILFDELSLKGGKKNKSGTWSTSADVLESLMIEGHTLPGKVLDWRQLAKLKNTYTDALINELDPGTGRVHTSFSQAVTSTGRLSSNEPNLQNIPIRTEDGRKIRQAFVPGDGHLLMSADYSQIELRLLAHVAKDDSLKDAFHNGLDIHALTASQVFGEPIDKMSSMTRRRAKAINFGIVYGISPFGLARQLGITNSEAKQYIDAYFEKYPGIQEYMEKTKEDAKKSGVVYTPAGRKCHIRGINEKNPNLRGMAERAAINAPIQGGAADIIKLAMICMPETLKANNLNARMLLQVHDELVFEVPENEINETREVVARTMEQAFTLDVPLVVDVGVGGNWDEAH